jgi:hypothetical protein
MSTVHQQLTGSLALLDSEAKEGTMSTAITKHEVLPPPDAMQLLQMAVQQGAPIDTIERLAKLQREMVEYNAKLAFDQAMQRAQGKIRRIGADRFNPQTKSNYVTYAKLDGALRPIYTEEGFSLSFNNEAPPGVDVVRVLCYVSHVDGHTRTYQIDMPADGKGAKGGDVMTKTHATGAAVSYGCRYLLKMIFNVAVGETDDDGNGASGKKEMSPDDFTHWESKITGSNDLSELDRNYLAACDTAGPDQAAKNGFKTAAGKRYRELGGK